MINNPIWAGVLCLFFAVCTPAQQEVSGSPARYTAGLIPGGVPRLVPFSGVLRDTTAGASGGAITFSLFEFQEGGAPLWSETQSVRTDARGRYTVILGSTQPSGVPLDLFTSGKAVWLAAQAGGGEEQARVLLVAVPYALKAADADTLGGRPSSDFVTTDALPAVSARAAAPVGRIEGAAVAEAQPNLLCSSVTSGGGLNFQVPVFSSPCDIESSHITDMGGKIGIGSQSPQTTLDVAGNATVRGFLRLPATGIASTTASFPSQPLDAIASAFNSSTALAVNQHFRWQAEADANNTSAPSGQMSLLFASGTATPAETGLSIAANGQITFAAGQTYPGISGGISGVTAGTGLTGGGITGNVIVGVDTKKVPLLALANRFTASQSVTGSISATGQLISTVATGTAPLSVASTTQVPNLNATFLGGFLGTSYARTGTTNTFSGGQTIAATVDKVIGLTVTSTGGTGAKITGGTDSSSNGAFGLSARGGTGTTSFSVAGPGIVGFGGTADGALTGGTGISAQGNSPLTVGGAGGLGLSAFGGDGNGKTGGAGDAIDAFAGHTGEGATGRSALFEGSVDVVGTLTASSKNFRIDHPLDAPNRYLYHASVESSEMMNIYSGNAALDGAGEAVVKLPDWFQAENADFRYQLTAMGASAPGLYIAQEIANNEFRIAGGRPGVKVSWMVTGVRQDAYAKAHPLVVEQDKPEKLRGYYLNPEVFGQPDEKRLEIARNPEIQRQIKEMRSPNR